MSADTLTRIVASREQAHEAVVQVYAHAQALIADAKRVRICCGEDEDDRSLQANRFYWGVVLKQISEQARVAGQRYTVDAWHELFKRQFLGYEIVRVQVAGRKRATVYRRLRSTTKLLVKKMSAYLEETLAFAAADLGVVFTQTKWEEYRA